MNDCYFFRGVSGRTKLCSVLVKCECCGCRFYKTEKQYHQDQDEADEMLKNKGLMRTKKRINGQEVVTVKEWDGEE